MLGFVFSVRLVSLRIKGFDAIHALFFWQIVVDILLERGLIGHVSIGMRAAVPVSVFAPMPTNNQSLPPLHPVTALAGP